ncbi:nudix hydrolase 20 [Dichomitus squalens]|uniref:Nudix hydrolase 20 n=1 Tax=Dichomitus squalens TaxID=114155 RepID=A0A4Q9Q7U9_9APHY|nr:nudix hydrolase 20 [Dichomitus squalens]
MPPPTPTAPQSFLHILANCDNFRLPPPTAQSTEPLVPWLLFPSPTSPAVGLLRPEIVAQLRSENASSPSPSWHFSDPALEQGTSARGWVSFARGIDTPAARSRVMKELCERWRDTGLWPDEVGPRKWRAELYPVYRDPFGPRDYPSEEWVADGEGDALNYAFEMERAASGLFGIVTYGIHMTVYEDVRAADGTVVDYNVWVPRRAATKQTWPGYLDNSVAGGIEAGMKVFDCVVKESMEEASIPADVVRRHAKAAGSVSYFFRTPRGWLQPEIEYVYDLCLPPGSGVKPEPLDGEVESFELLPLSVVIEHIRTGLFKYNCATVLIDFMVRKGIITPDNEPDYQEIVTRLHGRFDHDRWTSGLQQCATWTRRALA